MSATEKHSSNLVTDPDTLAKLLEMELALKRSSWEQTRSRRGTWRALSILFLLVVIAGAIAAWIYLAPALSRRDETTPAPATVDPDR